LEFKENIYLEKKLKKKNLISLSLTKLIHGFGTGIFNVIYQPFILAITNSLVLTGVIVSIGTLMQFLPMPWVGKLSDKLGHKKTLFLSIPVYVLGLILLTYTNSSALYLLVIGISIFFLGVTLNSLNAQFLVSVNSNNSKGLMYGIVFTSFFIGSILGNSVVLFGTNLESQIFFILIMITFTIEGLIICLGIKTNVNTKTFSSTQERNSQKVGEKKLWLRFIKNHRMRAILIFFTVDLFVYGISLSIYNAGLSDYYNLTTEQISFIVIWMNITNMVFQIPAGRVADKLGKMKTLILSEFFGLIFMLLNIIAPLLWGNSSMGLVLILLILGRVSFAFSIVFFIPSEQIILTDLGKSKRAEAYGIVTFVRGIAFIPTGLIGGFLIENISYFAPFIISSIGILFEIWFLFRFFNQE